MSNIEGPSKPHGAPAESDQFSNPKEYAAFANAQRNVFDSYREHFDADKGEDGASMS